MPLRGRRGQLLSRIKSHPGNLFSSARAPAGLSFLRSLRKRSSSGPTESVVSINIHSVFDLGLAGRSRSSIKLSAMSESPRRIVPSSVLKGHRIGLLGSVYGEGWRRFFRGLRTLWNDQEISDELQAAFHAAAGRLIRGPINMAPTKDGISAVKTFCRFRFTTETGDWDK